MADELLEIFFDAVETTEELDLMEVAAAEAAETLGADALVEEEFLDALDVLPDEDGDIFYDALEDREIEGDILKTTGYFKSQEPPL